MLTNSRENTAQPYEREKTIAQKFYMMLSEKCFRVGINTGNQVTTYAGIYMVLY